MTADLIHPIIFLIGCLIVIDYFDSKLPLITITILSVPICVLFSAQVNAGLYLVMFDTDITAFTGIPGLMAIITGCMWVIPIVATLKTYYLKQFVAQEEEEGIIG